MVIKRGLAQIVYKFFDKNSSGSGVAVIGSNYQLANELHRQIIRTFQRRKIHSSFRDNICGVDLADIKSLSKHNKGIKYLLCAINLVNMLELFLQNTKQELVPLIDFKK